MSEPRNPLAALRRKAGKGQAVTVAFFGGSITWGGNSSDIESRSYRALVGEWFRRRLKGVEVACVNGGYGGTGSVAGAYRFDEHMLSHSPDLLFMEFAINDSATPQSTMLAAHEAIFRKAWRSNPAMGIVLLISGSRLDTQAEALTHRMGSDFGLHVVDVGAHKRRLIQSGRAVNDDLWADGVHPTDRGHAVYAEQVARLMGRLWREADGAPARRNGAGKPLHWRTPEYDHARLIPARDARAEGGGWTLTDDRFTAFDGTYPVRAEWPDRTTWPFPYRKGLMRTRNPGDSISWTGRLFRAGVALDYVEGPCRFDVEMDGKPVTTIEHKQPSGRFPRVPEFAPLMDGGKHTVKLTLREGSLNVGYFMVSGPAE